MTIGGEAHSRQREERLQRHFWKSKDTSVTEQRLAEGRVGFKVRVAVIRVTRLDGVHRSS